MRIAPIRSGHEAADIKSAKKILKQELDHPAKSVMVIRGDSGDVARFADRVATRSDVFPWREAVWLKVGKKHLGKILSVKQLKWFDGHGRSCAVLLDFADTPTAWFSNSASRRSIDSAYWDAKS